MPSQINAGAEFQALPIEYIISAPLMAAVKAQSMSAQATLGFVKSFIDDKTNEMQSAEFSYEKQGQPAAAGANGATAKDGQKVNLKVPLISLVPVPHLRIDSVDAELQYTVSETINAKNEFSWGVEAAVNGGANWGIAHVDFSVKATVASKSSTESTINRAGSVTVKVHASESPMPEGLARVLTMLGNAIQAS